MYAIRGWLLTAVAVTVLTQASPAQQDIGTAFTYQGELLVGGVPVDDTCDFRFGLWDADASGNQVGTSPQTVSAVGVVGGTFSVAIDFGTGAINGDARWLAIEVQCPGDAGFVLLSPRVELTPAPHALALPGLYTQQNATSPNVIGGHPANSVAAGKVGVTIAGGGGALPTQANVALNDYCTVSGGRSNTAGNDLVLTDDDATVGGGRLNVASGNNATISGGFDNDATGPFTSIGGGEGNLASEDSATICGGLRNQATASFAAVCGGSNNEATGGGSVVGGGGYNLATGVNSIIGGGLYNEASGQYSTVGGGALNVSNGHFSTIGGGDGNDTDGDWSTVSGGESNLASGDKSTIAGGTNNTAIGLESTVAGGNNNGALGPGSAIGGGRLNIANGIESTVSGGMENDAAAEGSAIGGGRQNTANGLESTVAGGKDNQATGSGAAVGGGRQNIASGSRATVSGGYINTASGIDSAVVGGTGNVSDGDYSFVAGGSNNKSGGANSFAGGFGAVVRDEVATGDFDGDEGTFIWGGADYLAPFFTSTGPDQFLIRAAGGVGINTNDPDVALEVNGGTELTLSDSTGWVMIGDQDGANIAFDTDELQARNNAASAALLINPAGGNVGIGTTDADVILEINGGSELTLTDNTGFVMIGDQDAANLGFDTNEIQARNNAATADLFLNPAGGNVAIRATTALSPLHVEGGSDTTVSGGGFVHIGGSAGLNVSIDNNEIMARDNGTFSPLGINVDGGDVHMVVVAGDVGIGTNTPSAKLHVVGDIVYTGTITDISDERLKQNIVPLNDALAKLGHLRGVYFNMSDTPDQRDVGLIAQDVQAVLPEAVSIVDPDKGFLGVSYPSVIPLLVEAIKDQEATIADRDCRIDELEARLQRLERALPVAIGSNP